MLSKVIDIQHIERSSSKRKGLKESEELEKIGIYTKALQYCCGSLSDLNSLYNDSPIFDGVEINGRNEGSLLSMITNVFTNVIINIKEDIDGFESSTNITACLQEVNDRTDNNQRSESKKSRKTKKNLSGTTIETTQFGETVTLSNLLLLRELSTLLVEQYVYNFCYFFCCFKIKN